MDDTIFIAGEIYNDSYFLENLLDSLIHGDKKAPLTVWICSPGGSVTQGNSIASILKMYENTTCIIIGQCASIATIIALACNHVKMDSSASWLIHEASVYGQGNADELRKQADYLDQIKDQFALTYAKKTGKTKEAILELMKENKPITAQQALEWGFIDEIVHDPTMVSKMQAVALDRKNGKLNNLNNENLEMKSLLMAMGLSDNATEAQAMQVYQELKTKVSVQETAIASIKKAQVDEFLASAIDSKMSENEKVAITEIANSNLASAKVLFAKKATAPATVPVSTPVVAQANQPLIVDLAGLMKTLGSGAAIAEDRSTWKIKDWKTKDAKGFAELRKANPDEFNAVIKRG